MKVNCYVCDSELFSVAVRLVRTTISGNWIDGSEVPKWLLLVFSLRLCSSLMLLCLCAKSVNNTSELFFSPCRLCVWRWVGHCGCRHTAGGRAFELR